MSLSITGGASSPSAALGLNRTQSLSGVSSKPGAAAPAATNAAAAQGSQSAGLAAQVKSMPLLITESTGSGANLASAVAAYSAIAPVEASGVTAMINSINALLSDPPHDAPSLPTQPSMQLYSNILGAK
jgi:hypothetical protein